MIRDVTAGVSRSIPITLRHTHHLNIHFHEYLERVIEY